RGRRSPGSDRLALLRDLDGARLANDDDLHLPRVLELVLDLASDLVGEEHGAVVVDLGGLDDHPDLASGLKRVRLRDSWLRARQLLKRPESADVVLERLAAGAWSRGGDRVGGDEKHRLDRLRLHLVVV